VPCSKVVIREALLLLQSKVSEGFSYLAFQYKFDYLISPSGYARQISTSPLVWFNAYYLLEVYLCLFLCESIFFNLPKFLQQLEAYRELWNIAFSVVSLFVGVLHFLSIRNRVSSQRKARL